MGVNGNAQRRRTPSFSSSLLDSIYRSIDAGGDDLDSSSMVMKQQLGEQVSVLNNSVSKGNHCGGGSKLPSPTLRRAIMMETWIERQTKTPATSKSAATNYSSSSSSSVFSSSSETEQRFATSRARVKSSSSASSASSTSRRYSSSSCTPLRSKNNKKKTNLNLNSNSEEDDYAGFTRTTKLRALKLYGELKKVKQPISPGGRISNFLNSIFSPGGGNKVKMCSIPAAAKPSSAKAAALSSSPISASCFSSNATIRSVNHTSDNKRSVRFYPVTVILDQDSRPCGHKSIYNQSDPGLMPTSQRVIGSGMIRNEEDDAACYRRASFQNVVDYRGHMEEEEEDDSDDEGSCSSSDLFELDHLSEFGSSNREELPVYETTNFARNNRVIHR